MSEIIPTAAEAGTLRALRRAGGELPIGDDAPLSHALRLAVARFVVVTPDHPQRAVITDLGRSAERACEVWS